jgi:heat shock protein HtpX
MLNMHQFPAGKKTLVPCAKPAPAASSERFSEPHGPADARLPQANREACPECGADTPVIEGFKRWCEACNWNVEPYSRIEDGFLARQYHRIGKRRGQGTLQSLITQPVEALRPRLTASKLIAYCLALVVHASSLVTFAAGVYLVASYYSYILAVVLGLTLCGLAWLLRPSFGKVPEGALPPTDFPALYLLVNNVAQSLGGKPIQHIVVDETFNAAYASVGLRREPVLWLGLPLWIALEPQERVALLGHEIAHGVNGDSTRGTIIGTALDTLEIWISLLRADNDQVSRVGAWLWSLPIAAVHVCLAHLLWHDKQKAEFLADYLGATVAGTSAAVRTLVKSGLHEHLDDFLSRHVYSASQSGEQMFQRFREHIKAIPEREMQRLQRASCLEDARLDSTHPPTAHRIDFLQNHVIQQPKIEANPATMRDIDLELRRLEKRLGSRLISRLATD